MVDDLVFILNDVLHPCYDPFGEKYQSMSQQEKSMFERQRLLGNLHAQNRLPRWTDLRIETSLFEKVVKLDYSVDNHTIGRRRDDETRPKTLKEAFDFVNFQRLSELSEIPAMGPEDIDESLAILEAQLKALFEAMAEPNPKYEGEQGRLLKKIDSLEEDKESLSRKLHDTQDKLLGQERRIADLELGITLSSLALNRVKCKVCLDKNISRIFIPCGHICCCADCCEILQSLEPQAGVVKCPICLSKGKAHDVFVP